MGGTQVWFKEGLRFSCTQCGHCCTGSPGYVWVTERDVLVLAEHLGQEPRAFVRRYVREVQGAHSLLEKPNGDCVFWDRDAGCTVYAARPPQCRSFPFWRSNVKTQESWAQVCRECPGAGRGRLHAAARIARVARSEGDL